mmetsp:Transcript_40565/g.75198  ORF Transcript_40565/g.75198 Transcript_40565/m.75198 type:complete len:549 (-) Transcript_40565:3-1649(-)|eukprot:CAMPEP_0197443814 /NCGR_PEP_ID=MMETSP1175-20131217/9458_1 /TAXON_ID=1003142 /ORGANISM="Triceratium dubium, Strain CCMP147" /LENGTH=548 /DNA_ID=CAMNT_0042974497 /DNA_START=55 /DNA_END=1701 /DNA_ORIENTATION=-
MILKCLIVGTGDMAHGLCHTYDINNESGSDFALEVSKPREEYYQLESNNDYFHDTGVRISNLGSSLHEADIVILAIPASALSAFVRKHAKDIKKDAVLVDVTNSSVKGQDLESVCFVPRGQGDCSPHTLWVKAFNDNGAIDLISQKASRKGKLCTKVCGPDREAVEKVKVFAEQAMGFQTKVVPYHKYEEIAVHQENLGSEWVSSAWVLLIIFIFSEIYSLLRYNVYKGYDWIHLPIQMTNKAICWTAIYGFALTLLPGTLMNLRNAFGRDKLQDVGQYMKWALDIRKHLGLLSFFLLVIHVVMSLLIFNPAYYGKFYMDPKAAVSKLNLKGELSMFFGIVGFSVYCVTAICSLPSVGMEMNKRQWGFAFGPTVWFALCCGTAHVLTMGVKGWTKQDKWPGGMPPITLTSTLLPMLVIAVKVFQLIVALPPFLGSTGKSTAAAGKSSFLDGTMKDPIDDPVMNDSINPKSTPSLTKIEQGDSFSVESPSSSGLKEEEHSGDAFADEPNDVNVPGHGSYLQAPEDRASSIIMGESVGTLNTEQDESSNV